MIIPLLPHCSNTFEHRSPAVCLFFSCAVFSSSFCTQVVDRAGIVLSARGIRSTSIVGGRTRVERSSAVSSFTNDHSIRVILLTTGSAAAGAYLLRPPPLVSRWRFMRCVMSMERFFSVSRNMYGSQWPYVFFCCPQAELDAALPAGDVLFIPAPATVILCPCVCRGHVAMHESVELSSG